MRMKSFSAWTYIANNKLRSTVLVIMMMFTAVCFVGDMYVNNVFDSVKATATIRKSYIEIGIHGSNNDLRKEFWDLTENILDEFPEGKYQSAYVSNAYTITRPAMGEIMECNFNYPIFNDEQAFNSFRDNTDIIPKDINLADGEVVISEQLANTLNVKVGDSLCTDPEGTDTDFVYYIDLKVKAIIDVPGSQVFGYYDCDYVSGCVIFPVGGCSDEVYSEMESIAARLREEHPKLYISSHDSFIDDFMSDMGILKGILWAVVVLLGAVLAVTVYAAFSAGFDKRKYEFSIYKAIGFSRKEILGKITSEILLMDLFGLILGALFCTAFFTILNKVLWSEGIHFYEVSLEGIIATLICNLMVVIPVIFLSLRKVKKYDVTEY